MLVKVNGTNMVRDTASMALINTDQTSKNEYYNKVRMIQNQKEEINKVKTEIESLKNDLGDIKEMMKQLLAKG
jgi:DNA-binding protein H-NS